MLNFKPKFPNLVIYNGYEKMRNFRLKPPKLHARYNQRSPLRAVE